MKTILDARIDGEMKEDLDLARRCFEMRGDGEPRRREIWNLRSNGKRIIVMYMEYLGCPDSEWVVLKLDSSLEAGYIYSKITFYDQGDLAGSASAAATAYFESEEKSWLEDKMPEAPKPLA